MTPLKAIRAKCLECAQSVHEVKVCHMDDCPLHQYRFGKNPKRKGMGRKDAFVGINPRAKSMKNS